MTGSISATNPSVVPVIHTKNTSPVFSETSIFKHLSEKPIKAINPYISQHGAMTFLVTSISASAIITVARHSIVSSMPMISNALYALGIFSVVRALLYFKKLVKEDSKLMPEFKEQLEAGDFQKAAKVLDKMSILDHQVAGFSHISKRCDDLEIQKQAAHNISNETYRSWAFEVIFNKQVSDNDWKGAFETAQQMSEASKLLALAAIIERCDDKDMQKKAKEERPSLLWQPRSRGPAFK